MCWVTLCLSIPAHEPYEQCVGLPYVYPNQLAIHTNNVLGYIMFIHTSSRAIRTMCWVTLCLSIPAREPHEQCVGLHCVYSNQLASHTNNVLRYSVFIQTSSRATRTMCWVALCLFIPAREAHDYSYQLASHTF